MLSGLLRPSSGQADILGMNVWTQMGSIRQQMGVCPQQNVLFEDITVEEHLYMFGRLKGVGWKALREQVRMRLRDVGMRSKAKAFAGQLSGGQKRKLCLAIALMGDSKVLFLDEPTSGMDVFAQRSVWALLRKVKKNRIVVLTTHSMEEADMLGDRIGIMAEGEMVCCGTPLFLKSLYGVGYSLIITTLSTEKAHAFVEEIVLRHVPAATQHEGAARVMSKEISFQLPFTAAQKFEAMFTEFDRVIEDDGDFRIEAYGISVTTMEEVFLKSAHDASESMSSAIKEQSSRGSLALADLGEEEGGASGAAEPSGEDDDAAAADADAAASVVGRIVVAATPAGSASASGEDNFAAAAAESDGTSTAVSNPASRVALTDATKGAAGRGAASDDGGRAMMEQKLAHIKELQKFGFVRQLFALLLRRIAYARRDLKLALFQFAIPLLVLVFGLTLLIIVGLESDQPARDMWYEAWQMNDVVGIADTKTVLPYLPGTYSTPTATKTPIAWPVEIPAGRTGLDLQSAAKATKWPNPRQTESEWKAACATIVPSSLSYMMQSAVAGSEAWDMCMNAQYLLQTHDKSPSGGGKGGTTYLSLVQHSAEAYNILVNTSNCEYCAPIGIALTNTALYRQHSGNAKAAIITSIQPMPKTKNALASSQQVTGILFAIVLLLGWAFIPAAFVEFIVRERQLGVKHQMLISGTSIASYWLSNLIFDLLLSLISMVLIAVLILVFSWSGNIELFKGALRGLGRYINSLLATHFNQLTLLYTSCLPALQCIL